MNSKLLTGFYILAFSIKIFGQPVNEWVQVHVEPDITVLFPAQPELTLSDSIVKVQLVTDSLIYRVTSESSPLNYYGRTIKEVNEEFYSQLTHSTLDKGQFLISERDFEFENHHVREILYHDTIDSKPVAIKLHILNVIGIDAAMYKFYKIDLRNQLANIYSEDPFFENWNLYSNFGESVSSIDPSNVEFRISYVPIILPILGILTLSILVSFLLVKKIKFPVIKSLLLLVVGFLVFNFPIVEYWSIWIEEVSFWPEHFTPGGNIIVNEQLQYDQFAQTTFLILDLLSSIFLLSSVLLFIHYVNKNQENERIKILNWIPLLNIVSLAISVKRILFNWNLSNLTIGLWACVSILWCYYRFLALPLASVGIDSFSIIDQFLFGNTYAEAMKEADSGYMELTSSPIGYQFTYLTDLVNIIAPAITYVSGVLTLVLVVKMKERVPIIAKNP